MRKQTASQHRGLFGTFGVMGFGGRNRAAHSTLGFSWCSIGPSPAEILNVYCHTCHFRIVVPI